MSTSIDTSMSAADDTDTTEILQLLHNLHTSPQHLQKFSKLVTTGELRDYEQVFQHRQFYRLLVHQLQVGWRQYDREHIGATTPSEAFDQQMESEQKQQSDSGATQHVDSWHLLAEYYKLLGRLLAFSEFDAKIAAQSFAFDSNFVSQLVERFEPKFKRLSAVSGKRDVNGHQHQSAASSTLNGSGTSALLTNKLQDSNNTLANANGRAGAPIASALANVPASILASVGIMNVGIKQQEPTAPTPLELQILRALLHQVYSKFVTLRAPIRSSIAALLGKFVKSPQHATGVSELLAVYASVVRGFQQPLKQLHVDYLYRHILPLHAPNTTINELQPILQHYHEPLVYTIIQYLDKQPALIQPVITRLLTYWPSHHSANSNKEVLLVHELEKLLEYCTADNFDVIIRQLTPYLVASITSYQHRIAERALQLWQNDKFVTLCRSSASYVIPTLTPVLLRDKHWNKSVNKMIANVLQSFIEIDQPLFTQTVHTILKAGSPEQSFAQVQQQIAAMLPADGQRKQSESDKLLQQQAVVPDQLENLNYYDFVFGQILGEGSFSQVRYAKRIIKGRAATEQTQTQWPEYAVKIISKAAFEQNPQVEANVKRETAIMNALKHPNITRLVCVCQNATNLYLVQEYAQKGDLHTLISQHGSLDLQNAVFVAAETLRALEVVHQSGYIYADMKPENVLIFDNGHVKLADFGSAKPLADIKTGDRVEGTLEYLAPEVASNTAPISAASDLWAWACVLYQMLAGRTPLISDDDADILNKRKKQHDAAPHDIELTTDDDVDLGVQTTNTEKQHSDNESKEADADTVTKAGHDALLSKITNFQGLTDDSFPDSFPAAAKPLILAILQRDPAQRLTDISRIKADPLFAGMNWEQLHTQKAPTISAGTVSAADVDSKWSRRKNSIMWAPMPKQYVFTDSNWILDPIEEDVQEAAVSAAGSNGRTVGSSRRNETRRAEDLSTTDESASHRPRTEQRLSGVAESDEAMDEDSDDDDSQQGLAADSLLAKLARGRLPPPSSSQPSLSASTQHVPTVRMALPPKIPQAGGIPPLAGHRPKIASSRQLGSSSGNSLLQRMMANRGKPPDDANKPVSDASN